MFKRLLAVIIVAVLLLAASVPAYADVVLGFDYFYYQYAPFIIIAAVILLIVGTIVLIKVFKKPKKAKPEDK